MQRAFDSVGHALEFSVRLFQSLRAEGVALGQQQSLACCRAVGLLGAVTPNALLPVYRVTLVNRPGDLAALQRVFALLLDMHFSPLAMMQSKTVLTDGEDHLAVTRRMVVGDVERVDDGAPGSEVQGYSTREAEREVDFRHVARQDYPAVLRALAVVARRNAVEARRKRRRARHGRVVDLRASLRQAARYGGEVMEWRYQQRRPTHTRLTVVADVSGSMEVYSLFLLNFLHQLCSDRRLRLEVFVFSTGLVAVTEAFRQRDFGRQLAALASSYPGWSGGTRIGKAIDVLNEQHPGAVTPRTVVVIMSDGWDTGEPELLDRAMARLAARAREVVWLNPLKGDASYEPLAIGMATARPYCDTFIAGHSIAALERFAAGLG